LPSSVMLPSALILTAGQPHDPGHLVGQHLVGDPLAHEHNVHNKINYSTNKGIQDVPKHADLTFHLQTRMKLSIRWGCP